jgi:SAM-dependent methyltransferase
MSFPSGAPARAQRALRTPIAIGWARWRRGLRVWGLRGALRESFRHIRSWRARRHWAEVDQAFDDEYGVDTAGIVPLQALTIASANKDLGHRYQAANAASFRALMSGLGVHADGLTFIDLGAGKGRAMLLASEHPFSRVIGVEFAPALCEVARRNVERFNSRAQRCHDFEVVCADAAEYELPDEPSLVFIHNSFEDPLMRSVLAGIRRSTDERPRRLLLLLVNRQVEQSGLTQAGWRRVACHDYGELYEPAPPAA